jgi:hypothetical protein
MPRADKRGAWRQELDERFGPQCRRPADGRRPQPAPRPARRTRRARSGLPCRTGRGRRCHPKIYLDTLLNEPPELRRADGESVFTVHGARRYTSQAVLDAEQRLLNATRTLTINGIPGPRAAAALGGFEARTGTQLDAGQRSLVMGFAFDDRLQPLQVQAGDGVAVDWYCDGGRVRSGSRKAMADDTQLHDGTSPGTGTGSSPATTTGG